MEIGQADIFKSSYSVVRMLCLLTSAVANVEWDFQRRIVPEKALRCFIDKCVL